MVNTEIGLARLKTLEGIESSIRHAKMTAKPDELAGLEAARALVDAERVLASGHHGRMCAVAAGLAGLAKAR